MTTRQQRQRQASPQVSATETGDHDDGDSWTTLTTVADDVDAEVNRGEQQRRRKGRQKR